MKIAIVGVGKIARDQHIPAIQNSLDWEFAATVSRHGSFEGIPSYTDLATLLSERPDIACVSLCMPPVPRYDYAMVALNAGRHVMLEKPPGASVAECIALETKARDAKLALYATWHSREAACVDLAREWLADKRLRRLSIAWCEDVRKWHPGQTWIWEAGGLGVFDPGINALSILTKILPVPVRVVAAELSFPENCETPIAATLNFGHPDGAEVTGTFDFRQLGDETWSIAAETDGGNLILSEGGARLMVNGVERSPRVPDVNQAMSGEYPRLYANMAKLTNERRVDMDLSPLILVADAFLIGRRKIVEPFDK
ncbi:MAG: Gfo/Idh/MocA family oxidoreductase [Rhizobiaceae bacterium]|nr:Gfo/Idh/MocA family oxidoreductase [Rhizobiaceae bacterium]